MLSSLVMPAKEQESVSETVQHLLDVHSVSLV